MYLNYTLYNLNQWFLKCVPWNQGFHKIYENIKTMFTTYVY